MLIKENVLKIQPDTIRNTFCLRVPTRIVIQDFIILEMSDGLSEVSFIIYQSGQGSFAMEWGRVLLLEYILYIIVYSNIQYNLFYLSDYLT